MAKIFVEGGEDATRVPFLRGILIRSLQDAGLPFDAAYELAMEVRDSLDDTPSITTQQLRRKILGLLQASVGQNIYSRYEKQESSFVIQVEQRDGQLTAFSRFEYQHDLEIVGLTREEALVVATTVYQHLTDRHVEVITTRRLGELTYRYLRKSSDHGLEVAHRFLVWRDFINTGRPLIFLIGGTAGSGKSTTATMLASHLDIVQ
jgi:2-phosphoglycerate kinase